MPTLDNEGAGPTPWTDVNDAAPRAARARRRPLARRPASWAHVFRTGLALWILSVVVTALTGNVTMIPTIVLLGSFLVPVTAVVWYLDHYQSPACSVRLVLEALLVGGVVGVLAATVLEAWLLKDGVLVYLGVGFLEELAKIAALMFVARGVRRTTRDGVVLGAAVGFGFAALESSGYAFVSLLVQHGGTLQLSLGNLVLTELIRGLLAPVGHGLWTAILGGALFAANPFGRFRLAPRVLFAYVGVATLHALWDSMRAIALVLTASLTETEAQRVAVSLGLRVAPTADQIVTFVAIEIGGLVLVSVIGFVLLWATWRAGRPRSGIATCAERAAPPVADGHSSPEQRILE